jgi:hypothetical protein
MTDSPPKATDEAMERPHRTAGPPPGLFSLEGLHDSVTVPPDGAGFWKQLAAFISSFFRLDTAKLASGIESSPDML